MSRAPFGSRLATAVARRGPLCVGIDPHPGLVRAWGLDEDVRGLEWFALRTVEALAGEAAVLKPQSAFFESYGSAGIAVLERVVTEARQAGALVLLDVKRGDIGSTMSAYAAAYLADGAPLAADAVTLSPYLGFGSLQPALELAHRHGRGVFVLARTSNPESVGVQHATVPGRGGSPRTVSQSIVDAVSERNAGANPTGDVGVVVGATAADHALDLSALNGPVLAPGLGAQGASASDVLAVFGSAAPRVLAVSARGVLRHGPDVAGLRAATEALREDLAQGLGGT